MSNNDDGLYTSGAYQFDAQANGIPLRDVDASGADQSIGTLVSNATSQMSSLFRSELELAKAELAAEAKKGAIGGGLFGVAGVIALYSSFFFFFFVAALLSMWLEWWAAFLIVFIVMIVFAGLIALVGFRKLKKIGAPKKTINSVTELKNLVPGQAQKRLEGRNRGMYS